MGCVYLLWIRRCTGMVTFPRGWAGSAWSPWYLVPGINILFPMLLMRMLASWVTSLVWCWHVLCLLSLTPRKNLHMCRCVSWQLSSWGLVCCWKASCKSFLNADRINWIPEHVLRKNNLETDLLCGIFYLQWTLSRSNTWEQDLLEKVVADLPVDVAAQPLIWPSRYCVVGSLRDWNPTMVELGTTLSSFAFPKGCTGQIKKQC